VGLGLAPFASPGDPRFGLLVVPAGAALVIARPRSGKPAPSPSRGAAATAAWLALVALTACGGGLALGSERLGAIDAGAFEGATDRRATVTGFVVAVPKRSRARSRSGSGPLTDACSSRRPSPFRTCPSEPRCRRRE
jgi:hypothetical protein